MMTETSPSSLMGDMWKHWKHNTNTTNKVENQKSENIR